MTAQLHINIIIAVPKIQYYNKLYRYYRTVFAELLFEKSVMDLEKWGGPTAKPWRLGSKRQNQKYF